MIQQKRTKSTSGQETGLAVIAIAIRNLLSLQAKNRNEASVFLSRATMGTGLAHDTSRSGVFSDAYMYDGLWLRDGAQKR